MNEAQDTILLEWLEKNASALVFKNGGRVSFYSFIAGGNRYYEYQSSDRYRCAGSLRGILNNITSQEKFAGLYTGTPELPLSVRPDETVALGSDAGPRPSTLDPRLGEIGGAK